MDKRASKELSTAVAGGDWPLARQIAAIKVAEMMEQSESPREVKSLSISLIKLIDACEDSDIPGDYDNTPYARIMRQAKEMENNGW